MIFFGLFQLILILVICFYEYKNKSIALILWSTLLIMFGFPHFVSCLKSNFNYSSQTINTSSLFVICFCVIYFFTRLYFKKKNVGAFKLNIENIILKSKEEKIFTIMVLVGFTFFVLYIYTKFGGFSSTSWQLLHEQNRTTSIYSSGDIIYLLYYFSEYFIIAFDGILVYFILNKRKIISIFLIILNIVWIIVSRTRTNMLPLFLSLLFVLFIKYNKGNIRLISRLMLFGVIGIILVYAIQGIRLAGSLSNFFSDGFIKNLIKESITAIFTSNSGGELDLRDGFYYFIDYANNFPGFGEMRTYKSLILLPFPNSLTFGLKPEDFAITMGRAYLNNYSIDYFSMHPTLFGDCYANLGFLGTFIATFWAFFISLIESKISSIKFEIDRICYTIVVCTSLFLIARGAVYYGCRMCFISVFLIWLVRHLILKIKIII